MLPLFYDVVIGNCKRNAILGRFDLGLHLTVATLIARW